MLIRFKIIINNKEMEIQVVNNLEIKIILIILL